MLHDTMDKSEEAEDSHSHYDATGLYVRPCTRLGSNRIEIYIDLLQCEHGCAHFLSARVCGQVKCECIATRAALRE